MPVPESGFWVLGLHFFTICANLPEKMAFSFTFPNVIVVSDLNKNIGGSMDLVKIARFGGFAYSYSLSSINLVVGTILKNT